MSKGVGGGQSVRPLGRQAQRQSAGRRPVRRQASQYWAHQRKQPTLLLAAHAARQSVAVETVVAAPYSPPWYSTPASRVASFLLLTVTPSGITATPTIVLGL